MIKLGTEKELFKIKHLPINIQSAISEDIRILDNSYGKDRNVDVDMGGFVIVCDKGERLNIRSFQIDFEVPEFLQSIYPYIKKLYISPTSQKNRKSRHRIRNQMNELAYQI